MGRESKLPNHETIEKRKMQMKKMIIYSSLVILMAFCVGAVLAADKIVHDAEYYIL